MRNKTSRLAIGFAVASVASVASVVFAGAVGSALAADEWFVLSEKTIKTADQGVEPESEGGRWAKGRHARAVGIRLI